MNFILPHSWTGNCFIKTMIYVHLHGNRGGTNQMVVTYYLPVSCIGICHIWTSLTLHL